MSPRGASLSRDGEDAPHGAAGFLRRRALFGVAGMAGLGLSAAGLRRARPRPAQVPLLGQTVGTRWDGTRVLLDARSAERLVPGTRVVADPAHHWQVADAVRDEQAWLADGTVPGRGTRWEQMARYALLDLRTLLLGDGALVAGWPPYWRYVWPRDASASVAALCATGHLTEALAVLSFLSRVQGPDGRFQARYLTDGSGPPDTRGIQLDGTGWSVWAAGWVARHAPRDQVTTVLAGLRPLIDRCVSGVTDLLDPHSGLPPVSPDYWEVKEQTLTLGTVAPLLAGLESSVELYALLGDPTSADRARRAGDRLRDGVQQAFGPRYPRHLGDHDSDAAFAFLLPPIGTLAVPGAVQALARVERSLTRPAGGLAPGSRWQQDGMSWTPETALFALSYAANGSRPDAERLLDWLDRHRTGQGSLPEKVLHDGSPAGPAPLTWTSAIVLLALSVLDGKDGGAAPNRTAEPLVRTGPGTPADAGTR